MKNKNALYYIMQTLTLICLFILISVVSIVAINSSQKTPTTEGNITPPTEEMEKTYQQLTIDKLNNLLSTSDIKFNNLEDVNNYLIQKGFNISLMSMEGYSLAWDLPTNKFILLDEFVEYYPVKEDADRFDTFVIVNNEEQLVSYASGGYGVAPSPLYEEELTNISNLVSFDNFSNKTTTLTIGTKPDLKNISIRNQVQYANIFVNGDFDYLTINNNNVSINLNGNSNIVNVSNNSNLSINANIKSLVVDKGTVTLNNDSIIESLNAFESSSLNVKLNDNSSINEVVMPEDNNDIILPENVDKIEGNTSAKQFAGGNGTAQNPYRILNEKQLRNITKMNTSSTLYYELINDIELTTYSKDKDGDIFLIYETILNANINGNNYTIKTSVDGYMFNRLEKTTLHDIRFLINGKGPIVYAVNSNFKNIIVDGEAFIQNNESSFICYPTQNINADNIVINTTITGTGSSSNYSAVFFGYGKLVSTGYTLTLTNSEFNGHMLLGNPSLLVANFAYSKGTFKFNNIKNNGTIIGIAKTGESFLLKPNPFTSVTNDVQAAHIYINNELISYNNLVNNEIFPLNYFGGTFKYLPQDENLNISVNADNSLKITPSLNANIAYYEVKISAYAILRAGGTSLNHIIEKITNINNPTTTIMNYAYVDKEWIAANPTAKKQEFNGRTIYTLGNNSYYALPYLETCCTKDHKPLAIEMITVSAYDSNNALLCAKTINL